MLLRRDCRPRQIVPRADADQLFLPHQPVQQVPGRPPAHLKQVHGLLPGHITPRSGAAQQQGLLLFVLPFQVQVPRGRMFQSRADKQLLHHPGQAGPIVGFPGARGQHHVGILSGAAG